MSEREVERNFEQNNAHIVGMIDKEFERNHEQADRCFVKTYVNVPRRSGECDVIPVVVDVEQVMDKVGESFIGKYANVYGRICTYAKYDDDGNKTVDKYLYATQFDVYDNKDDVPFDVGKNEVNLVGQVLYDPESRVTPLGRVITEFSVLSHRKSGKSDRVPCIAWGGDAIEIADIGQESRVELQGRFQSRNYMKRFDDDNVVQKTAYEVSVRNIHILDAVPKAENSVVVSYEGGSL